MEGITVNIHDVAGGSDASPVECGCLEMLLLHQEVLHNLFLKLYHGEN